MKKLIYILLLLPVFAFGQINTTPQFLRNTTADSLLAYRIPGLTGTHWLPDTAWIKHHVSRGGSGVPSVFGRTGAVTAQSGDYASFYYPLSGNPSNFLTSINSSQVTTALGFTPYNATNPAGYITGINSSAVTTALGFTPYNATNPSGYLNASAAGALYYPLSGNPSNFLTAINSSQVTTALGFTPYNASNPSNYISTISGITAGGDLTGTYPNPTVAKLNGQLPSYYLNYANLTGTPTIPAQFNPIAGTNITLSGTYPNITFSASGGTGGITALTGDVTASGSGSVAATLATSGVTAGSYTNSNITVDAKGRVTAAANGSGGGTSTGVNGLNGTTNIGIGGTLTGNTTVLNNGFSYYGADSVKFGVTSNYVAPTAGTVVVFGTSIEQGTGLNEPPQNGGIGWPQQFATANGLTLNLLAVSGSPVENQTPFNTPGLSFIARESTVPAYSSTTGPTKLLIIAVGPNDWYSGNTNYNPTNYTTDLTSFLNYCHSTAGWPVANIKVLGNSYVNPSLYGTVSPYGPNTLTSANYTLFRNVTTSVCSSLGITSLNLFDAFNNAGGVSLKYDGLHPNNQGNDAYATITQQFIYPATTVNKNPNIPNPTLATQSGSFSNLNIQNNSPVLAAGATILARGTDGNVGVSDQLPDNFQTGAHFYTTGQIIQKPILATSDSWGTNDWILGQPKIWSYFQGDADYKTTLQTCDNGDGMTFSVIGYSAATAPVLTLNSPVLSHAFSVLQNGQAIGSGYFIPNFQTNYGLQVNGAGAISGFIPWGSANQTSISAQYSISYIQFNTSHGSTGSSFEAARFQPSGNLSMGTTIDNGFALDNAGTTRLQSGVSVGGLGNVPAVTLTSSSTGGTLTAGPQWVVVSAIDAFGNLTLPNVEQGATISSGTTNTLNISWTTVTGAVSYRVFIGTVQGAENAYLNVSGTSVVYTGSGTTSGTPPTQNTTYLGKFNSTGTISAVLPAYSTGASLPVVYNSTNKEFETTTNGAHTIFTPTTGGTVTLVNNQYNIINPSGSLVALTVTLPSSPANNDRVELKFTQAVTTVTYSGGTVADGITSPIAGGYVTLRYDSGTSIWY